MAAAQIHRSAEVSPDAELGDRVQIGANVVIEGEVVLGADCVIRPGASLFGPLTMGRGNVVYTGAVLGESPQHLQYKNEPTSVEIGDGNTFREHVTVHRGTAHSKKTVIGNHNYLMVNSHVGHDSTVGDRCILVNGSLVGGHCQLGDNVYLSGNCAVHQFVRIGRLAMLSGCATTMKDMPPFVIQQGVDNVVGLNLIGMRRSGMPTAEINAVRRAFPIVFREGNVLSRAIELLEQQLGASSAVQEMIAFFKSTSKGINPMRDRHALAA